MTKDRRDAGEGGAGEARTGPGGGERWREVVRLPEDNARARIRHGANEAAVLVQAPGCEGAQPRGAPMKEPAGPGTARSQAAWPGSGNGPTACRPGPATTTSSSGSPSRLRTADSRAGGRPVTVSVPISTSPPRSRRRPGGTRL